MTKINIYHKNLANDYVFYAFAVSSLFFWLCFLERLKFNLNFFTTFLRYLFFVIFFVVTIVRKLSVVKNKKSISKFTFLFVICAFLLGFLFCLLQKSGVIYKFKSIEDVRDYVSNFGKNAILTFILIQFSQVVFLPIPGVITTCAGVLLFGPFHGAIYSFIGIILGSIFAYFFGSILGQSVIKWLIGEKRLEKYLTIVKQKGKFVLFALFLFPFFPDDMLCFVLGVAGINFWLFVLVVFLTRFITIFFSSFSFGNVLIPLNTWWGIMIWIFFFAILLVLFLLFSKKIINKEKVSKIQAK